MEKFWMVWRKNSSTPVRMHDEKGEALVEAERLAVLNPGSIFFILETVASVEGSVQLHRVTL